MKQTPRAYQLAIYNSIMQNGNTLVVLPTGLGKTLIALMLIRELMAKGKCLFMTPTKPLAKQHFHSVLKTLELSEDDVALVSGEVSPKKRAGQYAKKVIISTPQTIRNDIEKNIFDPKTVALAVFDECHKAIGNYAYTFVAQAIAPNALIVGLTASPGGKRARIEEVANALSIKNVEIRTHEDLDVEPYVQKTKIRWIHTSLPPTLRLIKNTIQDLIDEYAQRMRDMGFPPPLRSKSEFIKMRKRILAIPSNIKYPLLVQHSILLNLMHMTELIETQGVYALNQYLKKLGEKKTKSAKILQKRKEFLEIKRLADTEEEHPKLKLLIDLLKTEMRNKKVIVFAQYRDQIKKIVDELQKNEINAKQFVGKKDGVTKKIQEQTIGEFRDGAFHVMVATSIVEEGLDIPAVDAVIFYEPVPSEIRSIQRRGRAGRFKEGETIILITKGTRDEYYYWSALKKEKGMKAIVSEMQKRRSSFADMNDESFIQMQKKTKHMEKKAEIKKPKPRGQTKIDLFFED